MRIVYITEYFPYHGEGDITGGAESRCFNIAKELSKKHEMIVITSWKNGQERKHNIGNIKIYRAGQSHEYSNEGDILSRLKFSIAAYKIAKKIKADVIEGYNFISYLPAFYASKKTKSKSIATYHETWLGEWIKNKGLITGILGEIWERWTLSRRWNKIISVSNFTAKRIKKRTIIVPNGINIESYTKKETKFKEPTVCSISRLTPKKRVQDLIKAIAIVKKEIPTIKLIVIGKGDEITNLKSLANRLNLQKNIEFKGFVKEHKDVIKYLKKSHIFCLPSILEGFGIVLLEAMASRTPYVCSDIEVLKEVTIEGKGGFIFKNKDPKDLANRLLFLLKNNKIYKQKIEEGNNLVKKYDWKLIAKRIEGVYKNESAIHI
jgi:glycosyltransferase involved in cell wall biosynthesis